MDGRTNAMHEWDNPAIAGKLLEMADLLEQQATNPFRVNAYRRAGSTRPAQPGCRSCTRNAVTGTLQRFSQTPRGREAECPS
jgi:hypothetical protein